ncbi:hypothetical protein GEV1026_20255 [Xanthomonas perforans]|uniref:Uncharacterized protein n=1 Tax=Xanthomonas perforans TaxID=442694 RepID=A0ABR5ERY5_XANPE|nr:hypothetical protein XP315_12690 [Xanthomonas perforans]KLC58303.1 hypothetical protein GEV839_21570 [Xanthomonas perforans]KLD10513.1 hypothetical protein GEV1026_20255 [Xanthomonas perforans]OHX24845.1 hypothetical protein BHL63_15865 [Xanthomonas alfalfae]OMQ23166.1 hypothetical protein XpCFBP7293_14580 [Xanthomonas perforans]
MLRRDALAARGAERVLRSAGLAGAKASCAVRAAADDQPFGKRPVARRYRVARLVSTRHGTLRTHLNVHHTL